jgi:hypothetical protein
MKDTIIFFVKYGHRWELYRNSLNSQPLWQLRMRLSSII